MNPENKQFLDDHRKHYDTYVKAQVISHFDMATRKKLLQVIQEEFQPSYPGNLWCQSCVAEMLVFAYRAYDKKLAEQPKEEVKAEVPVTPPVDLEGQVKAETFPAHEVPEVKEPKKRGRQGKKAA